jgi:hypothetical protein
MRILDLAGDGPQFRRTLKVTGRGHGLALHGAPLETAVDYAHPAAAKKHQAAKMIAGTGEQGTEPRTGFGQISDMFHAGSW